MMQFGIFIMMTYFTHFASSTPELSVMQYPEDASVLPNSTVWMLCVFEYPSEKNEKPVVYWRKGPHCHHQQSLQASPSTGGPQVHITKNTLRGFSILKLSNVDQKTSNSYFCDVMLTEKIRGKCGKGTKLTVQDLKCQDCASTSDEIWWGWFLLFGYTIFVTTVIIAFGIHRCHTKCKKKSRTTDSSTTMQSEWIYEPSRPINNEFNHEYEDMSVIRTLSDTGRRI